MPKIGDKFQRVYGDKKIVVVLAVQPITGLVKIKDGSGVHSGIHYVSAESFEKYFESVEDAN